MHEELWRAFHDPSSPRGASRQLGSILVAREDPRLVVADPNLIASAPPLELLVPGDSSWQVSILLDGATVIAAMAARAIAPTKRRKARAAPEPPRPPARWEEARFAGGGDTFPVDYATAAITDALGAGALRGSEALRAQVARRVQGPPGCELFDDGRATCDLAWFGSGRGDGRYRCFWGHGDEDGPAVLLIPFVA